MSIIQFYRLLFLIFLVKNHLGMSIFQFYHLLFLIFLMKNSSMPITPVIYFLFF